MAECWLLNFFFGSCRRFADSKVQRLFESETTSSVNFFSLFSWRAHKLSIREKRAAQEKIQTVLERRTFEPKFLFRREREKANVTPSRIAKCRRKKNTAEQWMNYDEARPKKISFRFEDGRAYQVNIDDCTNGDTHKSLPNTSDSAATEKKDSTARWLICIPSRWRERQTWQYFSSRNQQIDCESKLDTTYNMRTRIRCREASGIQLSVDVPCGPWSS